MISQIRELQKQGEQFAIELSSGRVIQIYDPWNIATDKSSQFVGDKGGTVAVLHSGGAFELLQPEAIVAVTKGIHAQEKKLMKERIAKYKKLTEEL